MKVSIQTCSTAQAAVAITPQMSEEQQADYAAVMAIEDIDKYLVAAMGYFRKWHPDAVR